MERMVKHPYGLRRYGAESPSNSAQKFYHTYGMTLVDLVIFIVFFAVV